MAEREVAADLIGARYDCDECGEEMTCDHNTVLLTHPPKYQHRCPNGHEKTLLRIYPHYRVLISQEPVRLHPPSLTPRETKSPTQSHTPTPRLTCESLTSPTVSQSQSHLSPTSLTTLGSETTETETETNTPRTTP